MTEQETRSMSLKEKLEARKNAQSQKATPSNGNGTSAPAVPVKTPAKEPVTAAPPPAKRKTSNGKSTVQKTADATKSPAKAPAKQPVKEPAKAKKTPAPKKEPEVRVEGEKLRHSRLPEAEEKAPRRTRDKQGDGLNDVEREVMKIMKPRGSQPAKPWKQKDISEKILGPDAPLETTVRGAGQKAKRTVMNAIRNLNKYGMIGRVELGVYIVTGSGSPPEPRSRSSAKTEAVTNKKTKKAKKS